MRNTSLLFSFLLLTFFAAKGMGGRLASPSIPGEAQFRDMVHELAKEAKLAQPPDVYIIPSEDMNAFAAGTKPGAQVTAATTVCRCGDDDDDCNTIDLHLFSSSFFIN